MCDKLLGFKRNFVLIVSMLWCVLYGLRALWGGRLLCLLLEGWCVFVVVVFEFPRMLRSERLRDREGETLLELDRQFTC